jgi:deferrochelatase/peroxidase EfeB
MSPKYLAPPEPILDGPYQSGIVDPIWPSEPPPDFDSVIYRKFYAGQLERQRHLHIIFFDITVTSRTELRELLIALSEFAQQQMRKIPPPLRPFDEPPKSRRVSVTIGVGARLFTTVHGDDRYGLAGLRPRSLKIMPSFAGDDGFLPSDQATDMVVLVASDDYYVNEFIFGWLYYGNVHTGISVRRVERGYARPDSREPSGFEDGVTNPKNLAAWPQMDELVFVHRGDPEPDWCVGGTYLGYRKIRRRLSNFFSLSREEREAVFGVDRDTGDRKAVQPRNAHASKMNPRRGPPDFMGVLDDSRRFLRRPYFFNDGLDAEGNEVRGVHHISFARDLVAQYEWPIQLWQTNRHFPTIGAGLDALYEAGGAANIGGGYYFLPAAANREDGFVGSRLFR